MPESRLLLNQGRALCGQCNPLHIFQVNFLSAQGNPVLGQGNLLSSHPLPGQCYSTFGSCHVKLPPFKGQGNPLHGQENAQVGNGVPFPDQSRQFSQ